MATSLIYRSAAAYKTAMFLLYGRHHETRYRVLADLIPARADVLELCCGPGDLYRRHLRCKSVHYRGLDINRRFVAQLIRDGAFAEVCDIQRLQILPVADYVIMQAALYHFLPDASPVVDRMLRAARCRVIIAEPIRNLCSGSVPLLSWFARHWTDPGSGQPAYRFTPQSLDKLFSAYSSRLCQSFFTPGEREKVYVFSGTSTSPETP